MMKNMLLCLLHYDSEMRALLEKRLYYNLLPQEEREVMDYVLQCFGIYNGGVLREMTHREEPWCRARQGLGDTERCTNTIHNEDIREYFGQMDRVYNLHNKAGVEAYIKSLHVI